MEPTWDWSDLLRRSRRLAARYGAADADDVVQTALERALRMRASCRAPERPWPWVRRIVVNEARRQAAARHDRAAAELVDEIAAEDRALDGVAQRVDVARAIRNLPPTDRLVLGLRYVSDQTQPAIAMRLGLAEGTVKVRLHRARRNLRSALTPPH